MFDSRRFWIAIILWLAGGVLYADENHFKNVLVGDRAATMGGAFIGISDDSSGGYYNPAGLAFGVGDSISGSGNALHRSQTKYEKTIGTKDWYRDSETILPNFFGITKAFGKSIFAFSYIVPDSFIEHQDQSFPNILSGIKEYYMSLHSEEESNMVGPSYAYRINDSLSIGSSIFYNWSLTRKQQNEFFIMNDNSTENIYSSTKLSETSVLLKFGLQSNHIEPFTFGVTYSLHLPIDKTIESHTPYILSSGRGGKNYQNKNLPSTKPEQISVGVGYYPSHNLLFAFDLDYYQAGSTSLNDVINFSLGGEWFLDAENAFRFGYYTNNDNRPVPGQSTNAPHEKIDLVGYTFGYSSYTRTSSFTLGSIISEGNGKAQIYENNKQTRNIIRTSLTLLLAASYNY